MCWATSLLYGLVTTLVQRALGVKRRATWYNNLTATLGDNKKSCPPFLPLQTRFSVKGSFLLVDFQPSVGSLSLRKKCSLV